VDRREDASEQITTHSDLGKLGGNNTGVTDYPCPNLYHPCLEVPCCFLIWSGQYQVKPDALTAALKVKTNQRRRRLRSTVRSTIFLEIVDPNRTHCLHSSAPPKVGYALGDWAENDPFDISIDYF